MFHCLERKNVVRREPSLPRRPLIRESHLEWSQRTPSPNSWVFSSFQPVAFVQLPRTDTRVEIPHRIVCLLRPPQFVYDAI